MSRMLTRAKHRLIGAKNYRTYAGNDDSFVDSLCFDVQQSLEFVLKALVELHGADYVENHDIRAQLNKLDSLGVEVPYAQELRNMSVTINSWETESRYKDSFIATLSDVDKVIFITEELINFADSFIQVETLTEVDAFKDD